MLLNALSCHPLLFYRRRLEVLSTASADTVHLKNGRTVAADRVQGSSTEVALRATIHSDYGQLESDLTPWLADQDGE